METDYSNQDVMVYQSATTTTNTTNSSNLLPCFEDNLDSFHSSSSVSLSERNNDAINTECDSSSHPTLIHQNSELAQSMNRMMRESDAVLLEQGVEDHSAPATPCLKIHLTEEVQSPPQFDLQLRDSLGQYDSIKTEPAQDENTHYDMETTHIPHNTTTNTKNIATTTNNTTANTLERGGGMGSLRDANQTLDESSAGISKVRNHLSKTSSFQSLTEKLIYDNHNSGTGTGTTMDATAVEAEGMSKSSSYHRRLHEAAQYAEALGETGNDIIQVIIDDGESDDDSYDSTNGKRVQDMEHSPSYHRRLNEAAQYAEAIGEPINNLSVIIDDDESDDGSEDTREEDLDTESVSFSMMKNISPLAMSIEVPDEASFQTNEPSIHHPFSSPTSKSHEQHLSNFISSPKSLIYTKPSRQTSKSSLKSSNNNIDQDISEMEISTFDFKPDVLSTDEPRSRCNSRTYNFDDSFRSLRVDSPKSTRDAEDTLRLYYVDEPLRTRLDSKVIRRPAERAMSDGDLQKDEPVDTHHRPRSNSHHYFCHKLPLAKDEIEDVNVKGIKNNTLEVTKRGITRGNYAQLHRKAWLEVSDKYHRYGKNLRLYYKHWEKLGHPTNMFFDWLDSKGEAEGRELPSLPECSREVLDSDRVLYITDQEEQERYLLKIRPSNVKCDNVDHGNGIPALVTDRDGNPVLTGSSGWIFVLRDNELYGSEKVVCTSGNEKMRFHHSSFFGGKAVAAAGILITDENGCLSRLYPHSGHYRPGEAHMQRMLYHLYRRGVDLNGFLVDMQQIVHVSREVRDEATPVGGKDDKKKAKKTDSLQLKQATHVALFLAHKAKCIGEGLFTTIHKIRRLDPENRTVQKILDSLRSSPTNAKNKS